MALRTSNWLLCSLLRGIAAAILIASIAALGACATSSTAPAQTDNGNINAGKSVVPQASLPAAKVDPSANTITLQKTLAEYNKTWRIEYPLRRELADKCPTSTSYSYGMRMLQPASFRGSFSDSVQKIYGTTTDFVVIAVAANSAASKAKIIEGDRITKIGSISANQADAGPTLASKSKLWSKPYDVALIRDGQQLAVTIKPDLICDIALSRTSRSK